MYFVKNSFFFLSIVALNELNISGDSSWRKILETEISGCDCWIQEMAHVLPEPPLRTCAKRGYGYGDYFFNYSSKLTRNMKFKINDVDAILGDSNSMDTMNMMMIDEDYMGLMSDTLFSTITNQPFAFPDTRELGK